MFDYAHIAWKDVFGRRVRSLLSVGGIAVIVAVFLVLTSVATGLASIMAGTEGSARNLALIDRGVVDFCQGSISDTAVRHLRRWPELAAVAPMLHTVIQLDGRMTQVRAVPLDNYQTVENVTFASIPLNPVLKPETVAWSLALTLVLTWLGARFPARRAASVPVAEALRGV